jgi:hypothetical protein
MEGVDSGGLDPSRHSPQLIQGGTLTNNDETKLMKKPVEELTDTPSGKPTTKTERKRVIPATPRMFHPKHGLLNQVAQG